MSNRQLKPPPKVNALPLDAPPPRTDYLQVRNAADRPPANLFEPSSPRGTFQRPFPQAVLPPEHSGVQINGEFDADVQREMMKLEMELRKQLEQEETLAQLNNRYQPPTIMQPLQIQSRTNDYSSPRSSYDQKLHIKGNARFNGDNPQTYAYDQQGILSSYPNGPSDAGRGGIVLDSYNNSVEDHRYQAANPTYVLPPSYGTNHQLQNTEDKLLASKPSPHRGKGGAIANLYEPDPARHLMEKISRQNDYNRQLQQQIEERKRQQAHEKQRILENPTRRANGEQQNGSVMYSDQHNLSRPLSHRPTYNDPAEYAQPISYERNLPPRQLEQKGSEYMYDMQRQQQQHQQHALQSFDELERLRKKREQEEYRKLLDIQKEENSRLKPKPKINDREEYAIRPKGQIDASNWESHRIPTVSTTGLDDFSVPYQDQQHMQLNSNDITSETVNTSPNLKAARQRLITDVYGSAGMSLGLDNSGKPQENWKPSRRGAQDQSKEAVEVQKRILQSQIAEANERKRQEKEKQRAIDEAEERRVRGELANMGIDEQRNKELAKAIQQENYRKIAELQQQKTEQEALLRANMALSSPEKQWASPKRVLTVPGDSQWGGPMGVNPKPIRVSHGNVSFSKAADAVDLSLSQMQQIRSPQYNAKQTYNESSRSNNYGPVVQSTQQYYTDPTTSSSSRIYRENNATNFTSDPVVLRDKGGLNDNHNNFNSSDADYALVSWQRKHGFSTRRGNTPGGLPTHGKKGPDSFSILGSQESLNYRKSVDNFGEISFVSESKLVSDSRLLPSGNVWNGSNSLVASLSGARGYNGAGGFMSGPNLTPVEQSLTSDSLLLYLGQRTPQKTPRGATVSTSMAIPSLGSSPLKELSSKHDYIGPSIHTSVDEGEVLVVPERIRSFKHNPDPRDSIDSYGSVDNPQNNFVVHTPTREERAALNRSAASYNDDADATEIHETSWERANNASMIQDFTRQHSLGIPIAHGHFKKGSEVNEDLYNDDDFS